MGPRVDVVDEVLFEHQTPLPDGVDEHLPEWPTVDLEPVVKDDHPLDFLHLF